MLLNNNKRLSYRDSVNEVSAVDNRLR